MTPRGFEVGDEVIIRDWDDMADEFGKDEWGRVYMPCGVGFAFEMKYLCGYQFTIGKIDVMRTVGHGARYYIRPKTADQKHYIDGWNITEDMIRHADDSRSGNIIEIHESDFANLILPT